MSGMSLAHRRLFAFVAGSLVIAAVGGVVGAGLVVAQRQSASLSVPVLALIVAVVMSAVMAATLWLGARWWLAADEATREAHKWSWYWGGSTGLCIGGVACILITFFPREVNASLDGALSPAHALVAGMGVLGGLLILGYGLFWAAWWLARR
ncbi:hypothetical protein [Caulobacter hibisci]|uniref:Uncharacterized protein n=1 Tax=Caulobacter hibisci TaxID=2035993 RepID=A0ABS0T5L5_9CAUL|nr:hypothetical protein [Caulobacter hibisci]MBI1687066.1 hypothetical protein [Caulobacter hibisci]